MSVRAHRIIKVEYSPETTFNLSYDQKLVEFLDGENDGGFWSHLNDDACGQVGISVEALNKALKRAESLELDEYTVKAIKDDIAFAESQDDGYVTYDCF